MAAEKLYYENVMSKEFEGVVTECCPGKKGYEVALNRTLFYPEGGGQPYDTGTLGEAKVLEVHEKDGEVWHYTDRPLKPESQVKGVIDWERRFDLMQQHSGEHLVSGVIHRRFGYDNVGFHMGSDVITIDLNGILTAEELSEIEREVNSIIWSDRRAKILYPTEEELKSMDYRSKKELKGWVRLVEFPGADLCACCGLHVESTGQIGLVKLLTVEKFREGVRIEMLSGGRAMDYLNEIAVQNHQISMQLSAKPKETGKAVQRLADENFRLKGKVMRMEEKIFAQKAREFEGKGNVLLFEKDLEADGVRRLAVAVMETCHGCCAVFSGDDSQGYKYAIGEKDGNLREFVKEMNQILNGRGGGKPFFVQGSVNTSEEEIRKYFQERK